MRRSWNHCADAFNEYRRNASGYRKPETEPDLQDILVLNLTRAVQLCVDIGSHIISASGEAAPATMGDVFITLNKLGVITPAACESMKKAVGFRNIAVHNYEAINWEIVFAICKKSTADFSEFAKEICGIEGKPDKII